MEINEEQKGIAWHIPDWTREQPSNFWDPGRKFLATIRGYQSINSDANVFSLIRKKIYVLQHRFWSAITGADIPLNSQVGGGLLIPHPNGIVIHPSAVIGVNCLIFQQVTITNDVTLGYHVDIGAGAKIIGPLTIGDGVHIGANAVVTQDVPSGCTMVGIPAKPIKKPALPEEQKP